MSTDVLERPDTRTTTSDDDPIIAHIVHGKDRVTEAIVMGTPVTALCGKTWVPHRDPKNKPLCPECKDVAEALTGSPFGSA